MAGMQIASLFASIGADTSGLDRGLQSAKKGITGLANDIKKSPKIDMAMMVTGLNQAVQLASQAGQAIKALYGTIKEGAAMDFAVEKFDRLAESIGTTSNALMGDLRTATRGMSSDMDLVAMSSNIMSLGLMTTHDDVVRLSKVASALGMDMNQLVLTLANKTTMRFDQLGVAVAGFEDKVQALQDAGMSADDAFGKAFLQQAEEQVSKVGEAADSSIGSFQQMETVLTNLSNEFKSELAGSVLVAKDAIVEFTDVLSNIDIEALDIGGSIKKDLESLTGLILQFQLASIATEQYKNENIGLLDYLGYLMGAFTTATPTVEGYKAQIAELTKIQDESTAQANYAVRAQYSQVQSLFDLSTSYDNFAWMMGRARLEMGVLDEATYNAEKGIQDYTTATTTATTSTEEWAKANYDLGYSYADAGEKALTATNTVNSTSFADARGEIDATKGVVGDLALAYRDLELAQLGFQGQIAGMVFDDLTTKYKSGVISLKQYKDGLVDLDAAMGTDFSMELELEEKIPELTRTLLEDPDSFKDNIITVSSDFGELDENVKESTKLVEMLELKLMAIARTWNANVNINVNGNKLPTGTGGYQSVPEGADTGGNFNPRYPAVGGPVYTNSPYIVGERGPELFVPSGSGYILTNAQTANAMDGGGNGNLSEIVSRIPTARDIAVAVRDALLLAG